MRTQVMLIASLAAGCSFSSSSKPTDAHGIDTSHDGPPDSAIDAAPDAPQQDFGTGAWTVHVPTLPTAGVSIAGNVDTSPGSSDCSANAMWTDSSQPDACFIVGQTIATGNTVVVRGPRPLVLVATDAITIDKDIDVASHRSQLSGPGADWAMCGSPGPGASRGTGGGGGAGGTYITTGGSGGPGDNAAAGAGLPTALLPAPSILHGGCPGSSGGTGSSGPQSGGASGGGAIYVVAGHTITIASTGLVNASGAGATGGGHASGGGGGGSGGTIVLYAPTITATGGKLMANGGGGAGAGDNNSNGTSGGDAMIASPTTPPPGGNGAGGDGGNGYSTMAGASIGVGGNTGDGGGGGGGGAGYIRSNVMLTGETASPAVDVVP